MYGYHQALIYFKCRNCTFSVLGTHSLILPHRENRGRSGAGSPARGAVGGVDWGKERGAGASPRQWDPRGTCRLVSPPFRLCRSDRMAQRACGRSHTCDFPGLSREMLNSMSCPGKGLPSPVPHSHFFLPTADDFLSQEAREHLLPGQESNTTLLSSSAWATWTWCPDLQKFSYFGSKEECFQGVVKEGRRYI